MQLEPPPSDHSHTLRLTTTCLPAVSSTSADEAQRMTTSHVSCRIHMSVHQTKGMIINMQPHLDLKVISKLSLLPGLPISAC